MAARQAAPCLKCCDMIDINEAAIVVDFRLRTVGLEEATRSPQASVSICVTCTDLMAKGDEPPQRTQPLNHLVYQLVQEMVMNDPSFTFLSWIALRKLRGLPAPIMAEPKILKAWNDFKRVMSLPAIIERADEDNGPRRLKEVG